MATRLCGFLVVGLAVGFAGCGGDSLTLPPTTGTLEITAQTSGPSPDADGYAVSVDGTDRGAIGSNAAVTVASLTPGSHVAGLTGVDANCQVEGENLRVITVEAGATVRLTFAVACAEPPPVVGVLQVTTATTGQDIDPDGYAFSVDGTDSRPIGLNSTENLANTAVGPHTVVLSNVASNCTVDDASQGTTVTPGATATVAFHITCGSVGPTTGSIRVTTATSGENQDPDGYQFAIDNGGDQSIGVNGSQTVASIAPGSHTVTLKGVAGNCTVNDDSQGVTVTAGQTAAVNFAITCTSTGPTTGSIEVTTATSGGDQDPDGYQFSIDKGPKQSIGASASQKVDGVSPGSHEVKLDGIARNCTVNEDKQSVTVTAGQTAPVNFSITCVSTGPTTGSIRINTATSGDNQDDGYQFAIDNGANQPIGASDTKTVGDITPGSHTVVLSSVADNCTVDDDSQGVNVTAGQTADVNFSITCTSTGPSASNSSVEADPASIAAGVGSSTITVTVKNASGGPVAFTDVTLESDGTENTITPPAASTDANGVARFTFSSTRAETKTITATAGGVVITQRATVVVTPLASRTQFTADKDPSFPGESFAVTVAVMADGSSTPTGTVNIRSLNEPGPNCDAPLGTDGKGTCELSLTQILQHTLEANYSGDGRFETSSAQEAHDVIAAPAATQAPAARNNTSTIGA